MAFIPARGGSKRLLGKNIKLFGGFPLIYYSIAFARYNTFTKVIVSTDDEDIASIARKYGASVLMRPDFLSADTTPTAAAAQHCLESEMRQGFEPDVFITLQPTNPLRPSQLYKVASVEYATNRYDSVISVGVNKHKFGFIQDGIYLPQNYAPGMRSQDLKKLYYENGLLYLTKPSVIIQGDVFGSTISPIINQEPYSIVDIDDEFDFKLGECILEMYKDEFLYLKR
ncbi:MAG TPA: acylneuraminate cytidylyltransferase family protein [Cyclobacteriaceae bacterium]|nr:acylneuraminate cytidylyltransferase family protein [Cyclobacteriaceae bacterium]